ncbi:hypothetical protein ACFQ1I_39695 [Kitasatospora arboriphila]
MTLTGGPLPPRPASTLEQAALERVDLFRRCVSSLAHRLPHRLRGLAARTTDATVERAAAHAERWSDHAPVTVFYDHGV